MVLLFLALLAFVPAQVEAASGRIYKVLPQFLDLEGRQSLSPSLYERDAYQDFLRHHPEKRSTLRFDVQWKAQSRSARIKLRVEMRGSKANTLAKPIVVEQEVKPGWFGSKWASIPLTKEQYQELGDLVSWRATLWEGENLIGELKSFLW